MYFEWPQFQRCCFCMPLRRGVLLIAYLQILFTAFMVGIYSYAVKSMVRSFLLYHGAMVWLAGELSIGVYSVEFVFSALLIYAAHTKSATLVKVYYYFALATILTTVVVQIAVNASMHACLEMNIETALLGFAGLCIQLYQIFMVWSLLKKLETDESRVHENKLQKIVDGQVKVQTEQSNGVFKPSTIPCEDV